MPFLTDYYKVLRKHKNPNLTIYSAPNLKSDALLGLLIWHFSKIIAGFEGIECNIRMNKQEKLQNVYSPDRND